MQTTRWSRSLQLGRRRDRVHSATEPPGRHASRMPVESFASRRVTQPRAHLVGHVRFVIAAALPLCLLATACAVARLPPPPDREPPGAPSTDDEGPPGVPEQPGVPAEPVVPECTALAVRSCGLPYPSDEFVVADPHTATGRRIQIPDSGLVAASALSQLGPGAGIHDAFDGRDGYSALSPVVFEVDQSIDPGFVPPDGGDVVKVIDTSTGEAVPIRVELPLDAAFRGAPSTIVMVWPRLQWEYGHTYVARLARVPGLVVEPSAAQGMAWDTPWVKDLRATLGRLDDLAWSDLLTATRFTVGSREDAIGDLAAMARIAAKEDHPIRNVETVAPVFFDGASAVVSGEVAITDFRDEDGIVSIDRAPERRWVPFLLVVPERAASVEGAPVAIYGHGLVINKESMVVVASANAHHGVATLGIDVPNHGWRSNEGGFLLDLANPQRLGRLVNMPLQGIVDHVSLVSALTEHMADLDAAPWRFGTTQGDGRPDLDTSHVLYEGTSMGAVLGAGEVALIPEIDAAFLQVPGAGISDIIMHSILWIVFQGVVPQGAGAGDAAALMGAATMLLDRTDTTHLLPGLRDSQRPVFVQLGVGDAIVPTNTSDRFVALLGLPRIGKALSYIQAPHAGERIPTDGRGFEEVWSVASSDENRGFMAHVSFVEPEAQRLLDEWLAMQVGDR